MALNYSQLTAYINGLYGDGQLSSADYQLIINYILSNGEPETDPRDLIQMRRGNAESLPNLAQGEPAFTIDEEGFYIGGLEGNVKFASSKLVNNIKNSNGVYVESLSKNDAIDIKNIGFDYVIYYYHPNIGMANGLQQVRWLAEQGVNVIFSLMYWDDLSGLSTLINYFKNEPNIVGWYLFDEPDGNGITVAQQEAKIDIVNSLSSLPTSIACNANFTVSQRISKRFDLYFTSFYITNAEYGAITDIEDLKIHFIKPHNSIAALVGIEKCVPIMQSFVGSNFSYNDFDLIMKALTAVNVNKPCHFIYSTDVTNPGFTSTIKSDNNLKTLVKKSLNYINNNIIGREKTRFKTMIYDVQGSLVSVNDYINEMTELVNFPLSDGEFRINTIFPEVSLYQGFYPNPDGGYLVIDLGDYFKHLNIRLTARNTRNGNTVTVKVEKMVTPTTGELLESATFASQTSFNITKKDFNGRFVKVYFDGSLPLDHQDYLIFNHILVAGILK